MSGKVILAFIAGAVAGAAAVWKYAEQKFAQIADEEIASVKEAFSKNRNDIANAEKAADKPESEDNKQLPKTVRNYNKAAADYNPAEKDSKSPYIITPEEYGERDGFLTVTFTYFEDGVVTDEMNSIVEDVDEAIGSDFFKHFGEYEDDTVYVRNDTRHCDYEILRDYREYADVPHTEV